MNAYKISRENRIFKLGAVCRSVSYPVLFFSLFFTQIVFVLLLKAWKSHPKLPGLHCIRSSNAALIQSQTSRTVLPFPFLFFFSLSAGTVKRSSAVWVRLQCSCVLNASCNSSFLQLIEDLVVQKRRQRGTTV